MKPDELRHVASILKAAADKEAIQHYRDGIWWSVELLNGGYSMDFLSECRIKPEKPRTGLLVKETLETVYGPANSHVEAVELTDDVRQALADAGIEI